MFEKIKKDLYFNKAQSLINKGILEGKIVHFDERFYNRMNDVLINNIPVSIWIKYLKPVLPPGKCYDRSLYMFFCYPDSLLCRGDNKDLEYNYSKENAGHGWIEMGDYVYDPTLMMRFDKDLYYKIYLPTNVTKTNKDEYNKSTKGYYDKVRSVSREDFKIGGEKRYELAISIPLVKEIADMSDDNDFKKELYKYLDEIEYDIDEVLNEVDCILDKKFNK